MEGTPSVVWNIESSEHRIVSDAHEPQTIARDTATPMYYFAVPRKKKTVEIRLRGTGKFKAQLFDPSGTKIAEVEAPERDVWHTLRGKNVQSSESLWTLKFVGNGDVTFDLSGAARSYSAFKNQYFDLTHY